MIPAHRVIIKGTVCLADGYSSFCNIFEFLQRLRISRIEFMKMVAFRTPFGGIGFFGNNNNQEGEGRNEKEQTQKNYWMRVPIVTAGYGFLGGHLGRGVHVRKDL